MKSIISIFAIVIVTTFQMSGELEMDTWQFLFVIATLAALGGFTAIWDWFKERKRP